MTPIDYRILGDAIRFYESRGYKYIDAPWLVSLPAILATMPPGVPPIETRSWMMSYGFPVGSAEQSFIQWMMDEQMPLGPYVACTPCIRHEDPVDDEHRITFMKVELIYYRGCNEIIVDTFEKMITDASDFMNKYAPVTRVETGSDKNSYDLMYGDLELGSYGVRQIEGHNWAYGTGVAEPRLSIAWARHLQQEKSIEKA